MFANNCYTDPEHREPRLHVMSLAERKTLVSKLTGVPLNIVQVASPIDGKWPKSARALEQRERDTLASREEDRYIDGYL